MKAEMNATIGEFFELFAGEADAAAALPASSKTFSPVVVLLVAGEGSGVTGSSRQALN
jgi:hypothetical protein